MGSTWSKQVMWRTIVILLLFLCVGIIGTTVIFFVKSTSDTMCDPTLSPNDQMANNARKLTNFEFLQGLFYPLCILYLVCSIFLVYWVCTTTEMECKRAEKLVCATDINTTQHFEPTIVNAIPFRRTKKN